MTWLDTDEWKRDYAARDLGPDYDDKWCPRIAFTHVLSWLWRSSLRYASKEHLVEITLEDWRVRTGALYSNDEITVTEFTRSDYWLFFARGLPGAGRARRGLWGRPSGARLSRLMSCSGLAEKPARPLLSAIPKTRFRERGPRHRRPKLRSKMTMTAERRANCVTCKRA